MNQMIKKKKTLLIDLLCDLAGGILYAMGIYTFAKMADFAPGGLSGLALISNYLWGLPIGLMTLILNVPLVIVSYKVVGKQFLLKTARSMVISTIILDLIFPLTPPYTGSPFMAALYSGLCMGAGMAFFYMRGSSSGGMDFLIMTIKVRHPHFSLGMVTMVTDFLIILLGWPVFGNIDAVLYGLATAFVSTIVLDKILYGVGAGKLIIIITNEGQQLADRIGEMTDRGSTIYPGQRHLYPGRPAGTAVRLLQVPDLLHYRRRPPGRPGGFYHGNGDERSVRGRFHRKEMRMLFRSILFYIT